jgi:hypothetical protein
MHGGCRGHACYDGQQDPTAGNLRNPERKLQQWCDRCFVATVSWLSQDPMNVQTHLKKCFEGIKKLDMSTPSDNDRKQYLSSGIVAPDGKLFRVALHRAATN